METTKDLSFFLPIMITLWAAKFVGDQFNEVRRALVCGQAHFWRFLLLLQGIYDTNIEQAEIPMLGWDAPQASRNILASDIMRKDAVALEPRERVGRLLDILKNTPHHAFPVVDRIEPSLSESQFPDYGRLKGLVLRSQILTLLTKKHFTRDYEGRQPVEEARFLVLDDFRESYPQ